MSLKDARLPSLRDKLEELEVSLPVVETKAERRDEKKSKVVITKKLGKKNEK